MKNIKTFSYNNIQRNLNNRCITYVAKQVELYTKKLSQEDIELNNYYSIMHGKKIDGLKSKIKYEGLDCSIIIEKINGELSGISTNIK